MTPLFRTPVLLDAAPYKAEYSHPFLLMGSCFAEHIGQRMQALKFKVCSNPFGVLFNPASIAQSLVRLSHPTFFTHSDLECNQGLWFSYDLHGRFSHPDREQCIEAMNEAVREGHQSLISARHILLTLGTAWIYEHKEHKRIVANCHKTSGEAFIRQRLEPLRVVELLEEALSAVWQVNPQARVLFTVSPVRHLKEGSHDNQISKAVLLLAVEALCRKDSRVSYFPAYEIMMDELRDYRFYDADMVHPSAVAVDYIWNRFAETHFSSEAQKLMKEVDEIQRAYRHRPLHVMAPSFRAFLEDFARRSERLQREYPFLDLAAESKYFKEGSGE